VSANMELRKILILVGAALLWVPGYSQSSEPIKVIIGGTGSGAVVTSVLAEEFSNMHPEYEVTVSTKNKYGEGSQWVSEGGQLLGFSEGPFSLEDQSDSPVLKSLSFAYVKIGFAVTGSVGVSELSLAHWQDIYSGKIKNWSEVGGVDLPIVRLGYESEGSIFRAVEKSYPAFGKAEVFRFAGRNIPMGDSIKSIPGAIGYSDLLSLSQQPGLQILEIEGFDCLLEVSLVYEESSAENRCIKLFREFISGAHWRDLLMANPLMAPPEIWQEDLSPRMVRVIRSRIRAVAKMAAAPILIREVKLHNERKLTLKEIQGLDVQWAQGNQERFILALQENPVGKYLGKMVKGNPMIYTEAFVCGNQGAVVGEYPETSDYWQGDERKFTQCFSGGLGQLFIGQLEYDESTKTNGIQISVPVLDGEKTIGVLVVGIRDVENMDGRGIN